MEATIPERCGRTVRKLADELHVSAESAYDMLLLTAALMDMHPEEDATARMVLRDCGVADA